MLDAVDQEALIETKMSPPPRRQRRKTIQRTILFRRTSEFDSITEDGREVARTFGRDGTRFQVYIQASYRGCQRVTISIRTRFKGFQGPFESFEATTDDEREVEDGPSIKIVKVTNTGVTLLLRERR